MDDNIIQLPETNKMKEEGSLWLAKLDRGLSVDEVASLKLWLAKSHVNRNYFVALAKQWDQLSALSELAELIPYERKKENKKFSTYAKAASVALIFLMGSLLIGELDTFSAHNDLVATQFDFNQRYQTSVGEKSVFELPDSSVLTLNTDSVVSVHFSAMTRKLILEKGEAHIKVAHNKKRKLIFSAGDKSFIAIGTAFNVQYDNKSTLELIVTEGKVAIANSALSEKVETLFIQQAINKTMLVNAGERVIIPPQGTAKRNIISKENIVKEMEKTLAWRQGRLIFKGETLEEVIAEMSRYSNISIEFKSEKLKSIRIGGRFRTGDIDGLLEILHEQFNVKADRVDGSHIQLSLIKTA